MTRWLRGLGALAALLGAVVGVPVALVVLGGNPLPRRWDVEAVVAALLRPDDGRVLVGLVTAVGWVAWLVFAASVLAELANLVRPRRARIALPGLGGVQRWAAGLVLSVVALAAASQLSPPTRDVPTAPAPVVAAPPAAPTLREPAPGRWAVSSPVAGSGSVLSGSVAAGPSATDAPAAAAGSPDRWHVVRAGDDLWSLAEHYYGRGRDWRRIATANPGVLSGGPDRLEVGWRLRIPDGAAPTGPGERVRVRPGDTLTAIAERELGDGDRWRELYAANRDQLGDPDELPVGTTLALPEAAKANPTTDTDREPASKSPVVRTDGAPVPTRPRLEATAPPTPPLDPAPTAVPPAATTAPAASTPVPTAPTADATAAAPLLVPFGLAAAGGLLAAGLVGGWAARRRAQLQVRPLGRRILAPAAELRPAEVALARQARPLSLRTVDRATRAVAAHCHQTAAGLPALRLAYVADHALELVMAEPAADAPVCFSVDGARWRLAQDDVGYLASVPGMSDAPRPWPTLVSLGHDADGRDVLADLEGLGLLALVGPAAQAAGVLAALAVELSFSPWAEELTLTLVGDDSGLPDALGHHNVARCDDVDGLLERLERRAQEQRQQPYAAVLGQHRLDVDLAEAWVPEVVLVDGGISPSQLDRLTALATDEPRVTVAAVVCGAVAGAPWSLVVGADGTGVLEPGAIGLVPQALTRPAVQAVVQIVAATGSLETTPAPWWAAEAGEPPEIPPDNVTYLGRRFGETTTDDEGRVAVKARAAGDGAAAVRHPTLQLLGPVELLGAAGPPPPRAAKQCLEYCAWLLENPGTTAQAMAAALVVAEGTRRSNMSRLRSWLGADESGRPYLPDAYTGRIRLDDCVSSDWQQLQVLTVAGVNRTASSTLEVALDLVRGAPLADAAPGQWYWAEELRTDLISCVRDVGVELASRAIATGDVDLARWAAARALVAAPGDELLLAARVRTEHLAGNVAETERLSLQLAQQARSLGVDLDPATVALLQEVMEGRIRARMA